MTSTTLRTLVLVLGLLALPLSTAAATLDELQQTYAQHRFFFSEAEVWRSHDDASATYAMLELTALERIAGRQHLDQQTIRFLEDNLWDYEAQAVFASQTLSEAELRFLEENLWGHGPTASFHGQPAATGLGVYALDPDAFSPEILWQDAFADAARFEGQAEAVYPAPHQVPGLSAGELDY